MPRQGARRRAREAAGTRRARPGARSASAAQGEAAAEEAAGAASAARPAGRRAAAARAAGRAAGRAVDFEEVLRAPGDTVDKLFDLANKPTLCFNIGGGRIDIVQDRSATEHSGGVVWETAYFLARYFERHILPARGIAAAADAEDAAPLRVAELGAGCGLLGLALARLGCKVVLTEQPAALDNLRANVRAQGRPAGPPPKVRQLSWGDVADVAAVRAGRPFDLVVGSDVVFASRLVVPLLETIAALLADEGGGAGAGRAPECWLCLQQRDPDAHAELLRQAPRLFRVTEATFADLAGFEAAAELDCVLLRLRLRKRPRQQGGDGLGGDLQADEGAGVTDSALASAGGSGGSGGSRGGGAPRGPGAKRARVGEGGAETPGDRGDHEGRARP